MTTGPRGESPAEQAPYARRMSRESSVSYMDCLFSILAGTEQTSRHVHYTDDEGFYVLEGELTFYVGEQRYAAGPGTFVFLPHGVAHSYTFETDVVRMLSIVAPGGLERRFCDPRFSEPAKGTTLLTPGEAPYPELLEAMAAALASHGTEVVGPPREG